MLEVKYKENKAQEEGQQSQEREWEEGFELPKNVKQVGEVEKERKLYIEDYVMTYLQQLEKNMEETKTAVFLGEKRVQKDCHYLFISGILEIEDEKFGEEQRKKIEQEKKKYFSNLKELGWFLSIPGQKLKVTAEIEQIHRNLFTEDDTVLLMCDGVEQEEILFLMEENRLHEQGGYYIYYEQNPGMQEYLMDHKKMDSVEKETREETVVQSFRKKLRRKQEGKERKSGQWIYGASTMLVLAILVIGVTIINNYDKMKNMEKALTNISKQVTEESLGEDIAVSAQVKNDLQIQQQIQNGINKEDGNSQVNGNTIDSTINDGEKIQNSISDTDKEADSVKKIDGTSDTNVKNEEDGVKSSTEEKNATGTNSNVPTTNGTVTNNEENGTKNQEDIKKEEGESETGKDSEKQSESEIKTSQSGTEQNIEAKTEEKTEETEEIKDASVRPSQAVYIVKNGDTLADICQKYYGNLEKVEEICKINNIENQDEIWEGEKIVLP